MLRRAFFRSSTFVSSPLITSIATTPLVRQLANIPDFKTLRLTAKQCLDTDPALAINLFDKMLQQNPNHIETLGNKGFALEQLEKFDAAIKIYDQVIALDPNNTKALLNKGNILFKQKKYIQALDYFNAVLKLDDLHFFANLNKGRCLFHLGSMTESRRYLHKASVIKAGNRPVNFYLFFTHMALENTLEIEEKNESGASFKKT